MGISSGAVVCAGLEIGKRPGNKDKKIAVTGWLEDTDTDLFPFLDSYINKGIGKVICTDIAKDGMLQGPSIELYKEIMNAHPTLHLIASGGVSSMEDIIKLDEAGIPAVIFGKAIYEGKISLKELEKYGYKKGEDMCNVSFSCYGKEFDKQLDKILTINILKPLYIVEIDKKNKKIELLITKEYSPSAISYNENNIINNSTKESDSFYSISQTNLHHLLYMHNICYLQLLRQYTDTYFRTYSPKFLPAEWVIRSADAKQWPQCRSVQGFQRPALLHSPKHRR